MMHSAEAMLQWVGLPVTDDHIKAVTNLARRWAEADENRRQELIRQQNREAILAEMAKLQGSP
jgi:hypothetical protein